MSGSFETPFSRKTFITLSMPTGPVPEPAVSSERFLVSFLTTGVWLRALALESHAKVLASPRASQLQKVAASVAAYQQIGLAFEDAIVTFVAWSTWARLGDLNLADIYSRISLRLVSKTKQMDSEDLDDFWRKIRSGRAIIDGRSYLRTVTHDVRDADLPALFGLPWKKSPSVHLVQGSQKNLWASIPVGIRHHIELVTNPKSEVLTVCLNKIKHGPQVILESPRDIWIKRGRPNDALKDLPSGQQVRILTQGARTQESESEVRDEVSVAPFILEDSHNAFRWLNGKVTDLAVLLFLFGRWLLKVKCPEQLMFEYPIDPAIQVLLQDNRAYHEREWP